MYSKPVFRGARRIRFFFPFLIVLMLFVLGSIVQYLWNAILPGLLHTAYLNYWQGVGLLVLCRILFGNYRFKRRERPPIDGPGRPAYRREKWMRADDAAQPGNDAPEQEITITVVK